MFMYIIFSTSDIYVSAVNMYFNCHGDPSDSYLTV